MLCSSSDPRFVGCVAVPSRADVVTVLRVTTARQMRGDCSSDARRCLARGSALRPRIERARATDDARASGRRDEVFLALKALFSAFAFSFRRAFSSQICFFRVVPRSTRHPLATRVSHEGASIALTLEVGRALLLALELDTPTHDDPDDHPEQTERASEDLDDEDLHEERRVLRVGQRARRSDDADADSAD